MFIRVNILPSMVHTPFNFSQHRGTWGQRIDCKLQTSLGCTVRHFHEVRQNVGFDLLMSSINNDYKVHSFRRIQNWSKFLWTKKFLRSLLSQKLNSDDVFSVLRKKIESSFLTHKSLVSAVPVSAANFQQLRPVTNEQLTINRF